MCNLVEQSVVLLESLVNTWWSVCLLSDSLKKLTRNRDIFIEWSVINK